MLDNIIAFMAPHYCCGCDKIGSLLCEDCKYNIISDSVLVCVVCGRPTVGMNLCLSCSAPYERAWFVGERTGVLQRLIGLYKFERAKAGYRPLGDLLADVLPDFPGRVIVVPIPTVASHVRERGYDHMQLIAKRFAKKRNLELSRILYRKTNTKQRQASSNKRNLQARSAFGARGAIDPHKIYLIMDDVVTTGATIKYATRALRSAGAKHVWVVAIARQTLEK
jgi:ComF family protein